MRKKRKYIRRKMTSDLIIKKITSIRTKNNKVWMGLVTLAIKAKPRQAKKILAQVVANDQAVTRWMAKLGTKGK